MILRYTPIMKFGSQTIKMPPKAVPLSAQNRNEVVEIWVDGDINKPLVDRVVHIVPTGGDAPHDLKHVGTVLIDGGIIVLHVFM
jgi:hypothetical protein